MEQLLDELALNNEEEYLRVTKKIVKENKNNARLIFYVASHLYNNMYFGLAKKYFRLLLNTNMSHLALYKLAQIEQSLGNYDKARDYYDRVSHTEKSALAFSSLANMEFFLGNNYEAKLYYEDALELEKNYYILNSYGRVCLSDNDYDEAKYVFDKCLGFSNKSMAYMSLVTLYIKKEDYEKAYYYFLKYLNQSESSTNSEVFINGISIYLKYMLKGSSLDDNYFDGYYQKQLKNYSLEELISHMDEYIGECDTDGKYSVFDEDINICDVITYANDKIKDKNIYLATSVDNYIISFDKKIGKAFGCDTEKMRVLTIPNTKKILSINPVIAVEKFQKDIFARKRV